MDDLLRTLHIPEECWQEYAIGLGALGIVVSGVCVVAARRRWRRNVSATGRLQASLQSLAGAQRAFGSAAGSETPVNEYLGGVAYESAAAVAEYLNFHFGPLAHPCAAALPQSLVESLGDAPARVAKRCERLLQGLPTPAPWRALDVGCAVGGTTFALARFADEVYGIDSSHAFISAALELKARGVLNYEFATERDAVAPCMARVPADIERQNCHFVNGDVAQFLGGVANDRFHLVLCCNVLCRLEQPRKFLECLPGALAPEGSLVVLVTPYAWLEAWTARSEWLGRADQTSSEELTAIMSGLGFTEVLREEVPFLLAQNDRIHELFVSELTAWRWQDQC